VPFFSHETTRPQAAGVMSDATRYLCAAAYLSPQFANRVVDHLVASHRAVAPSRGIDIEPIVRHCLKARRLQLTRDIVLTVLLIAGLILVTLPLIAILAVTFVLGFFRGANWGRLSVEKNRVAGMALVAITAVIAVAFASCCPCSARCRHPAPTARSPAPTVAGLACRCRSSRCRSWSSWACSISPWLWERWFATPMSGT
jgi:hypothetical protein